MISKWFLTGDIGIAQKMVTLIYLSPSHGLARPGPGELKCGYFGLKVGALSFPLLKNYLCATIIPMVFLPCEYLLSLNVPFAKGFKVESLLYNS